MLNNIQNNLGDLIIRIERDFGVNFIKNQRLNYRESKRKGFLVRYSIFCEKIKEVQNELTNNK
jgi:predicted SpoU family rRNA methylase